MTKHKHYEHIIAFANGEILQKAVYGKDTWEDDLNPTFEDWQIYRVKPDEPKMYLKAEEIPRGTDCWTLNSYLASYKGEWYKGGIDIKLINARTVYFTEEAAIKAQNSKQAYIAIVNKIEEINRQENWVAVAKITSGGLVSKTRRRACRRRRCRNSLIASFGLKPRAIAQPAARDWAWRFARILRPRTVAKYPPVPQIWAGWPSMSPCLR